MDISFYFFLLFSEAFFVKEYILSHPEDGEKIARLQELMLEQEFSACIQASPVHFPNGSPRVCRNSAPASMSPDGSRVIPRRSPLSYPAINRYSSSSLSSQASAEVSNITGQSESSDEVFNMQPSPSTSSLSSTHSASPNVTSSAPSSARASPLLSDKHKHSRENACLSPRERPCSAIYPTPVEPSQRLLFNHIGDGAMPRSDPNLSAPEKAVNPTPSSWSLDSGKEARSMAERGGLLSPPVPPRPALTASPARHTAPVSPSPAGRSPLKGPGQSFTPSPVEYHSSGLLSNSPVLSGSCSSGISSLSRCSASEISGFENPHRIVTSWFIGMAPAQGWARRYFKAFCKGFFVAVPVAVTFLDRVACVARVEGASMQPSLNPGGSQSSDVVLLNHWKVRNFEVQRGDIVSLVTSQAWSAQPKGTQCGLMARNAIRIPVERGEPFVLKVGEMSDVRQPVAKPSCEQEMGFVSDSRSSSR
ncbi:Dedicator of cytokinesis protein 4 [Myotis brandtii]|uniref:Dedicator of cytokinesis protein 4 n=1 Tax=Myotis brandtii TaxID=109478 RepID=S7PRN5_MYOBR|nr:Dedicator of cytokinesis protein 4 [Myotis brandtii]